jgi:hypothetical protein
MKAGRQHPILEFGLRVLIALLLFLHYTAKKKLENDIFTIRQVILTHPMAHVSL